MQTSEHVNILLVDDQPAKLLSYEVILGELGENLIKASSAREALAQLLKNDMALVLIDVCMPELDGFELAAMIREHPRFQKTAIIFISAIHLADVDHLRGYEMGAVDYVPVPVVPQVLRAKVKVFAELYRKTRQLEALNNQLEQRVAERTAELEAASERQGLLAREVDHRARNALAVVHSIVRLTRADSIKTYIAAVEGRISALARAHGLISETRWQGADLGRLVEEEIAPYRVHDTDKFSASGPTVSLQPVVAQTLALALHELATNAVKYGSLSHACGAVSLTWHTVPGTLTMEWTESGGPMVGVPRKQGFGTRLIGASIERQLGGRVHFDWRPDGLCCSFSIPHGEGVEAARPAVRAKWPESVEAARVPLTVPSTDRVLLVEDEALVALMMRDLLSGIGLSVVGPCSSVSEGVTAARTSDIDFAILDVNLNGHAVYPVADELSARKVPFVFVTGYGAESVDRRFAHIPVLQKPVDLASLETLFSFRTDIGAAPKGQHAISAGSGFIPAARV